MNINAKNSIHSKDDAVELKTYEQRLQVRGIKRKLSDYIRLEREGTPGA